MKALTRIEAGATISSESSPNTTLEDVTSPMKQPLKATAPVSHMVSAAKVGVRMVYSRPTYGLLCFLQNVIQRGKTVFVWLYHSTSII